MWKLQKDNLCPRCGDLEDAPHVWVCQGSGATEIWDKSLDKLEDWPKQWIQTLIFSIQLYLQSWRDGTTPTYSASSLIQDLQHRQTRIGWHGFFEGWLVPEWTEVQQAYYKTIKSLRTGKRWTVALIKKMWEIMWDLWEHRNGVLHEKDNAVLRSEI
jgi:hypothetical protein